MQAVVLCLGAQASQSLSLAWNPSPDPNVVGYAVYYGIASAAYSQRLDAGTNTAAVVAGLTEGQTYFFVVVSYNAQGDESPPSNELPYSVPWTTINQPPTLDPLENLTIDENAGLQLVTLSGITSGGTNEIQTLTVIAASENPALIPNPTVNYVSPAPTGILTFTPATNAFGSVFITVTVNDGQAANNIITNSFQVTIIPTVAQLSIGSTVLQTGQTGSVPITFSSSVGATDLSIVLDIPPRYLGDLALQALLPGIDPASATVTPQTAATFVLHLAASAGQTLLGSNQIAQLAFTAVANQQSAFVPLTVLPFTATLTDGSVVTNRPAQSGRAVVIGPQSLLEAGCNADGTCSLTLYGKPLTGYAIEYTTNLANPTAWTPLTSTVSPVSMVAPVQGLVPAPPQIFYRAFEPSDSP